MKLMKRVRLLVTGVVQGVFFRSFTKETADMLGILGSVKNLPNGSVEIVAEGEKQKLLTFIDTCITHHAPARIDTHETTWSDAQQEFSDFSIQ